MSYYYVYDYYSDTSSSTNYPCYSTRSELTVNELLKVKKKEEKTSFMFDPKGIGEKWPEKKHQ